MSKYLLSLDQKEFLVKTPLIETYLDPLNSTYSANVTKKVVHLGYADTILGLQKLPLESCNIAEIYIRDTPYFDFSILKEDDFHDENYSFKFVSLRENSIAPVIDLTQDYTIIQVRPTDGQNRKVVVKTLKNITPTTWLYFVQSVQSQKRVLPIDFNLASTILYQDNGFNVFEFDVADVIFDGQDIYIWDDNYARVSEFFTPNLIDDAVFLSSTDYRNNNQNFITVNIPYDVDLLSIERNNGGSVQSMSFANIIGQHSNGGFGSAGFDYAGYNAAHKLDITAITGIAQFTTYNQLKFLLTKNNITQIYGVFTPNEGFRYAKGDVLI